MSERPLSKTEATALLSAARAPRDRAMVVLLWRAGLRNFEVCALERRDLEERPDGGLNVHVRCGKCDKARWVGIDKRAADYVQGALDASAAKGFVGAEDPLLPTRSGGPLHTSHLRRTIARLALTARIGRRVHPHCLRHTFARECHDQGVGIRELQEALGHDSLQTTQIYLQSIGCSEAVEATATREW